MKHVEISDLHSSQPTGMPANSKFLLSVVAAGPSGGEWQKRQRRPSGKGEGRRQGRRPSRPSVARRDRSGPAWRTSTTDDVRLCFPWRALPLRAPGRHSCLVFGTWRNLFAGPMRSSKLLLLFKLLHMKCHPEGLAMIVRNRAAGWCALRTQHEGGWICGTAARHVAAAPGTAHFICTLRFF